MKGLDKKVGVLIAQLGTPQAPTKEALYPYLKQFLGDPRVIEKNRFKWWFILRFLILTTRPKSSAALYKRIWGKDGSPLLTITQEQTDLVATEFSKLCDQIEVVFGMRYGKPSLESAIDELIERGCDRILLFNMYPQYSGSTTASNYDVIFKHLLNRRVVPTLKVVDPYYDQEPYVAALAATMNESLRSYDSEPERLVLSYHGIPLEYVEKGDPYREMCYRTTELLLPLLDYDSDRVIHTFQSRFGKDPWLEPYTDEVIQDLGKQGIKHIAAACPGFTTDCLETLDEIGNEATEEFEENGGERLDLIPCLNTHPVWIAGMMALMTKEMGSWLPNHYLDHRANDACVSRYASNNG